MNIFSVKITLPTVMMLFLLLTLFTPTVSALAEGPALIKEITADNAANAAIKANAPDATAEDIQAATTATQLASDAQNLKPNETVGNVLAGSVDIVGKGVAAAAEGTLIAVSSFILVFANMVVGIAGVLFNWVIVKTVFQFSTIIGNSPGLLLAWGILRDIGNMILLFGFIFMGLGVILDLHSFPAKKSLPQLIIFAILMNFSLFAAEAVIDTSNVFSTIMYNQANTSTCASLISQGGGVAQSNLDCAVNYGIAGHIMQSTGLSSIFAGDVTSGKQGSVLLGLALFATIAAVVLFAGAILLIIRAVLLTFLMVTAPIGFAGMAVPFLHDVAKKWWHTLIGEAFFAPVFLLLIFISLKITDGLSIAGDGNNLAAALTHNDTSVMGVYLIFFVVIGFLVASLIIAKKMGAEGAGFATNAATKLAFGGVALGSNQVFNRAGRGLTSLQQRIAPDSKVAKFATKNVFQPLAKTNFDLRKVPGVGSTLSMAGAGDGAKANDHLTADGVDHMVHEYHEKEETKERDYQNQIAKNKLNADIKSSNPQLNTESEKFLADLGIKELEVMKQIKEGNSKVIAALSPEKFEALMKSDKITESEKSNIKKARFEALEIATKSPVGAARISGISKLLKNYSKSDLENLPPKLLLDTDVLAELSDKQRDDLVGSQKRTNAERQAIRESSRTAEFERLYTVRDPSRFVRFAQLTPSQISKLDKKILQEPDVAQKLTPSMLMELQESKRLSAGEITTIANHISSAPTSPGFDYVQGKISPKSTYWS